MSCRRLSPAVVLVDDDGPTTVLVFLSHPAIDYDLINAASEAVKVIHDHDDGGGPYRLSVAKLHDPQHYRWVPGRDEYGNPCSLLKPAAAGSRGAFWAKLWDVERGAPCEMVATAASSEG